MITRTLGITVAMLVATTIDAQGPDDLRDARPRGFGGPPVGGGGNRGGFGGGGPPGFGGEQGPARRPDPDAESAPRTNPGAPSDSSSRRSTLSADQLKSTDRNKDGVIDKSELDALAKRQTEPK